MESFFYERQGIELPFSVDFNVIHDLDIEECDVMEIAFLIECKYCIRGIKWFFIANPLKDAGMEFFIENFFDKGKCNQKTFPCLSTPLFDQSIPVLGKGVEIYANGQRNEKAITEAIHQLMFGTSSQLIRAFFREDEQSNVMIERGINIKGRSFHSLICPIIVTTTDVRILEDADIGKLEKSQRVEEISTNKNISVFSTPRPPPYIRRYITKDVARDASVFVSSGVLKTKMQTYLTRYSTLFPSRYYLVNNQYLTIFIKRYIDYARKMLTYACGKNT